MRDVSYVRFVTKVSASNRTIYAAFAAFNLIHNGARRTTHLPQSAANGATTVRIWVGASYQKLGVVKPWPDQTDQGLYQVTKEGMDKMVFKVPSLRNIKKTGPYFHDGSVPTLDQAIRNMAVHQRGVTLTDTQVKSIESGWIR